MNDSIGKSVVSGFRVVRLCFLGRNKTRRCLALCFGLLVIVGLALFRQKGGHSNCAVRFTVQTDYFRSRSVEIMPQRLGDLQTGFWSEIPYYYDYVKPRTSFRKASEDDFQPVEVNSSYVYSAYLDDRLARDVDPKALPVVRIFTVLPRSATGRAKRNWHCVFWYEMVDLPLVMPVAAVTDLDFMGRRSSTKFTMVLCSLPTSLTSAPPTAVSLVTDICQGPQNHLPVIDLRKRRGNFEKLQSSSSHDTFSWDHQKVSNFTICIPPLFGDYMKTMEIIEFIELNRLLGADKFIFYLESPKQELVSCLRHYSKIGLVELNNWTHPYKQDDINYHGQILAQNECLFRMMYRTKYLINQDLDEFIIPTQTTNWQTMLDLIHKDKSPEEIERIASYNFRNLFFPLKAASDSSLTGPFRVRDYELKTLTKTTCSDKLNLWRQRSKVMGRPERILIWHVHEIQHSSLVRKRDMNAMVLESDGLLFHYRELSPEYSTNSTNRRMWTYQRQLFASVTSVAEWSGCRT